MSKKITLSLAVVSIVITTIIISNVYFSQPVRESLTYFPTDSSLTFSIAETTISLFNKKDNDEYIVNWREVSETEKEVYLRQDISFLFKDGILDSTMSLWKEETKFIEQEKRLRGEDSSHYQAISLHHAEIHLKDDQIKSAQMMSHDELYIIDSSYSPLDSFKQPSNEEQKEWKKVLDHAINQHLFYSWNELAKHYNLDLETYDAIPFVNLATYNKTPLPGLTAEESIRVIGQLWEGLYKNYLLGIELTATETVSPIGSKIPLILISKDRSHLIILIETEAGEKVRLFQKIN
ncbi:hypothetical protein ACFSCX_08190 [Bacillus salitolerans]|uniref:Uncharacterized protein n=1 Tax=Bacillus salitolerans TaxID=1437434 RepID=A0ABW4LR54_9BACI